MFVTDELGKQCLGSTYTGFDTLLAYLDSYRQRIDEESECTICTFTRLHAAKQHRAKHDVVATTYTRQHLCPCQMAYTGYAHPQFSRALPHTPRHVKFHFQPRFAHPTAIALHIQQAKWRGRLLHVPQHPPEKFFMLFPAHSESGLCDKIAERNRLRQLVRPTLDVCANLFANYVLRGLVADQMMDQ